MTELLNPFIAYLNRYTTVSPEHEAAFDEFVTQTPSPTGSSLSLKTKTEQFLQECFKQPLSPSVILTGNAGDGKTYLCRQVLKNLAQQDLVMWNEQIDVSVPCNGFTLRIVKDLSEAGEERGRAILRDLAQSLEAEKPTTVFLIAANEGRLRALLNLEKLDAVYAQVDQQLRKEDTQLGQGLVVIDLNQVTTSSYIEATLGWLTAPVNWEHCGGCPASDRCPMRLNAVCLTDARAANRLTLLYQVLEQIGLHVTIRDMLIHLAYTLTGGLTCEQVIENSTNSRWPAYPYAYYNNVFGEAAEDVFQRKAIVIQQLRRLKIGKTSVFEIDDFIINGELEGQETQREHDRLFSPALDLGDQLLEQERKAYLSGGTASSEIETDLPLLNWMPHCRRKLFFEWQNEQSANRLFPFLYLPDYLRLLEGDQTILKRFKRELILGLNRAFSGLYLTDSEYLFVTSEYAHTVEQPVPIVRFKVATDYIELQPSWSKSQIFDNNRITLRMEIPPPPRVRAEPISWAIDLLRFEYLMRRARGGTPNVLASECELGIRQLKDRLLSGFAREEIDPGQVTFFAASQNRYALQTLQIDQDKRIRM